MHSCSWLEHVNCRKLRESFLKCSFFISHQPQGVQAKNLPSTSAEVWFFSSCIKEILPDTFVHSNTKIRLGYNQKRGYRSLNSQNRCAQNTPPNLACTKQLGQIQTFQDITTDYRGSSLSPIIISPSLICLPQKSALSSHPARNSTFLISNLLNLPFQALQVLGALREVSLLVIYTPSLKTPHFLYFFWDPKHPSSVSKGSKPPLFNSPLCKIENKVFSLMIFFVSLFPLGSSKCDPPKLKVQPTPVERGYFRRWWVAPIHIRVAAQNSQPATTKVGGLGCRCKTQAAKMGQGFTTATCNPSLWQLGWVAPVKTETPKQVAGLEEIPFSPDTWTNKLSSRDLPSLLVVCINMRVLEDFRPTLLRFLTFENLDGVRWRFSTIRHNAKFHVKTCRVTCS
ncbi:hypothetical protein VP01_1335g2 [Puccinia sorghi]|uniref:Uncharacterized protein n=1 Tax=Puccinia sorghi TaxID=27349 RepID=A0A0L6VP47_9BASI|nr:hypothetical protein VP01_1335g2 [Puccinia sorghi]